MSVYFPRVLLMHILARLPGKSLFRFKCVSKELCSLLSDGYHLIYHRSWNSGPFSHYSLHDPTTYDEYFRFELPSYLANLLYINSCRGLSCLLGRPNAVILWNPLTREFLTLPTPSLPDVIGVSVYTHGLGFDQSSNEYKVVRLVYLGDTSVKFTVEAEVYSLTKRNWRRVNGPTIWAPPTVSPAYVNGVVHWICANALLLFDVSDELFRTMKLPDGLTLRAIAACRDSLLACDYDYELRICGVWVMKEYGVAESWMRHTVIYDTDCVIRGPVNLSSGGKLLASTRDGELLFGDRQPLVKKKLGNLSTYVDKWTESLYT